MSSPAGEVLSFSAAERAPSRWSLFGAFAVIYLVWGSTFLGIRIAVETLPPLSMAAIRFIVSGGVLLLASSRVRPRPTLREWRNAAIVGALFFLGNHGLVSSAAPFIPSSLSCLIIATEVPTIALLSSLLLPNRPLTRAGLIGAALGVAGVVCLFAGKGNGSGASAVSVLACLAVLGASWCWAFGAVLSQRLKFPPNAILRAAMQMSCGAVMLSAASLLRGEYVTLSAASFSARSLLALGYLITFGSVLAFACYSYLLKHVRADTVATHVFVNPLVAVALGAWLGGERLRPAHLISGLLILASVSVILLGQRRSAKDHVIPKGSKPARPALFALPRPAAGTNIGARLGES
ncbi:MAG TPA: EamA family transporter [Myxococcales bacterium]|nr:EamA family transporter [Myxococcales bacterium]